jgi:iron(III) transport system substrate-binding protein
MLSVEGQQAACKGGFTPYRPGVDCAYGLPAIEAAVGPGNAKPVGYPKDIVEQAPSIVARWKKAYDQ